jgi:hypothetical protein
MKDENNSQRESILLRILWMLLFVIVWQVTEVVLAVLVVLQLGYRLFNGVPRADWLGFGDSLSQYLAQIGRFGTFNTEQKPWPFAPWPTPRPVEDEVVVTSAPITTPDEPKL